MTAHYCRLNQESLLHVSGPDTLKFLQGQTTCDTDAVSPTQALAGAYCNPQGRMVCDFLLSELGTDHFALRMRSDILDTSAQTFGKYIVFSKAELDRDNDDWQLFACWGDSVTQALAAIVPDLPNGRFGCTRTEHVIAIQVDDNANEFECYINATANPEVAAQITASMDEAPESCWQALQIASGMGRIEAATVEEFIPQMLNFDITGHVSFTKGCYTGQEVVARMHYRGKPKRRAYIAHLSSGDPIPAGTPLFTGGSEQSVGNVANSAVDEHGHVAALVVATVNGVDGGLHVGSADGGLLDMGTLPYSLEKT